MKAKLNVLIDQIKSNFGNMKLSNKEEYKFLMLIEACPNLQGICNYGPLLNSILEANHLNFENWKEYAGYDLFVDGKINDYQLLTDIHSTLNKHFIERKPL